MNLNFILAGILLIMLVLVASNSEAAVTCTTNKNGYTFCVDSSTGKPITIKPRPGGGVVIQKVNYSVEEYNEADIKYIVCFFDETRKFYCVNTRTGRIWYVDPKRVV